MMSYRLCDFCSKHGVTRLYLNGFKNKVYRMYFGKESVELCEDHMVEHTLPLMGGTWTPADKTLDQFIDDLKRMNVPR